jgi:hypothetical protein
MEKTQDTTEPGRGLRGERRREARKLPRTPVESFDMLDVKAGIVCSSGIFL